MPLGDPSPSPERDPQRAGNGPARPELVLREFDPISTQIHVENPDRLVDVLHLCGIAPNDSGVEYLWSMLSRERVPSIENFRENLGPLGLNLELDVVTKHEVEWRRDPQSEKSECYDKVSATLSTKHREGSELASLVNLSEGCPALEGLFVELVATPFGDSPIVAKVTWDEKSLAEGSSGERWELLRGFYSFLRDGELPESAPLAPGQREDFHYLTLDLEPFLVQVQRLSKASAPRPQRERATPTAAAQLNKTEIHLTDPPLDIVTEALSLSGALQLNGPWADASSPHEILTHLRETLRTLSKIDMDTLKMCENADPCLMFCREERSDGASFPPTFSSRVSMLDYTSKKGEVVVEMSRGETTDNFRVILRWTSHGAGFNDIDWNKIHLLTQPYLGDER